MINCDEHKRFLGFLLECVVVAQNTQTIKERGDVHLEHKLQNTVMKKLRSVFMKFFPCVAAQALSVSERNMIN